jgi:ribosomal protein L35AE/L33A
LHLFIKSEIKFSSNLPTPVRWKSDEVFQQLKELKMKKKKLIVIKQCDSKEEIFKKFVLYLENQGFKVIKGKRNEIR